jgi:hypothetical protein
VHEGNPVIPVSPKWVGGSGPFSDASLQRAMDRAIYVLSTEHPDHTFAIVAHADDEEGASLSAIVKIGDEWKLEGSVVKGFDQPFKWGAQAIWSR